MIDFLMASDNIWFSVAIFVVLSIAILEFLGLITGLSLFGLLDDLLPLEADLDLGDATPMAALSFLGVTKVPFSIWLIIFVTSFGMSGLVMNLISVQFSSSGLPQIVSIPSAVIFAFLLARLISGAWAQWFPQVDSNAVSSSTFEGLEGKITVGTAKQNSPAEAVVVDRFGQKHYLMVEPMDEEQTFSQGSKIVLVIKHHNVWWAIPQTD